MADPMMAQTYRAHAEAQRACAEGATLQNVRDVHTRAAERWTLLAERLERPSRLRE